MAREAAHQPDNILIIALAILILLGLLMLFTASIVISKEKTRSDKNPEGSTTYYFFHQILFALLPGIFLAFLISKMPISFFKSIALFALFASIFCLLLIFIPKLAFEAGGATRWVRIAGYTFQPSELAKLALILYFGALFEKKFHNNQIKDFKSGFLPFLLIFGAFAVLLVLQPDMGTLIVMALISLFMFFMAQGKFRHILLFMLIGIIALLLYMNIFPHSAQRFTTFLNPEKDIKGAGYQINQSLIAIGSGGLTGVGIGNGIQKYNYLPETLSDTIFAVWAEETGLLGSLALIIIYLIIGWRGLIISKRAPDKFSQLVAVGITTWIVFQAFLNIMANSGLVPFTGLPLPLVSYGGTAIITTLMAMGILINISKKTI